MSTSESKRSETRAKGDFNIETGLPAELLAVKPRWTIPVSANYSVFVYDIEGKVERPDTDGKLTYTMAPMYGALMRHNKSGLPHRSVSLGGYHRSHRDGYTVFGDLLSLRFMLEATALALRPKPTTAQVNSDEDA